MIVGDRGKSVYATVKCTTGNGYGLSRWVVDREDNMARIATYAVIRTVCVTGRDDEPCIVLSVRGYSDDVRDVWVKIAAFLLTFW